MNADPHFGKPPSNGTPDPNGSAASFGSASPTGDSGSGPPSSNGPKPSRRKRRSMTSGPSLAEAAASGWQHALELGDYARSLIGIRADRAAIDVRRKITKVAIAAVAAFGLGAVVISAAVRFVSGTSEGLALLFGKRAWLGDLGAAVLILGGLAAGGAAFLSRREKKELEEHLEKYENQHREHRARHGHFVGDAAPADPRGAPRP